MLREVKLLENSPFNPDRKVGKRQYNNVISFDPSNSKPPPQQILSSTRPRWALPATPKSSWTTSSTRVPSDRARKCCPTWVPASSPTWYSGVLPPQRPMWPPTWSTRSGRKPDSEWIGVTRQWGEPTVCHEWGSQEITRLISRIFLILTSKILQKRNKSI